MYTLKSKHALVIVAVLALFMVMTRFHHFGSPVHLPDASLAVFFLAGFYIRRSIFFPVLLAEASLIDYLAIAVGGVSDWCVTPAYAFLIPTYASLWLAGRWYARRYATTWHTLLSLAVVLLVGTSIAFLFSNGGFYLFSGYFTDWSWSEYVNGVVQYLPRYLTSTFLYVALAAGVHIMISTAVEIFRTRGPIH